MHAVETRPKAQPTESRSDPMRPAVYRVQHSRRDTEDTFTLTLAPERSNGRFSFQPGQFNMLYAPGVGECAISISGDPAKADALVHTTRVVGTVTTALKKLKRGDALGIRGPFGRGWPVTESKGKDVVLVAGGIGLAPLRPALYALMAHRAQYGRIVLLYGARTPHDILYRRELERWGARFDLDVYVTVDRAEPGWHGNVGVVTHLVRRAPFDRLNATTLVCGPEVMMRFAVAELQKRGIPDDAIAVSLERNMKCATGFCGHCQFGPAFVCKDGPVFAFNEIAHWFEQREI